MEAAPDAGRASGMEGAPGSDGDEVASCTEAAPILRKQSEPPDVAQEAAAVLPRSAPVQGLIGDRAAPAGVSGACSTRAAPSRQTGASRSQSQVTKYSKPAIEDYDPAKPEYVQPATERQVLEAEVALLRRQSARLAAALGVRSAAPPSQQNCVGVLAGYRQVLDETRHRLSKATARLAELPHDAPLGGAAPEEDWVPAGDGTVAVPQPKESCNGVEVASTRASTCAVSDLEELLHPSPEASPEKLVEGHAAGWRGGSGGGRRHKSAPAHEEEECCLEGAAVHLLCGLFGVPLQGFALRACAF